MRLPSNKYNRSHLHLQSMRHLVHLRTSLRQTSRPCLWSLTDQLSRTGFLGRLMKVKQRWLRMRWSLNHAPSSKKPLLPLACLRSRILPQPSGRLGLVSSSPGHPRPRPRLRTRAKEAPCLPTAQRRQPWHSHQAARLCHQLLLMLFRQVWHVASVPMQAHSRPTR